MEERDDDNRLKKAFPPDYAHIADWAYKSQGQMKQIDAEIDRLRQPSGPIPVPSGGPGATTREAQIAEYAKQRAQISTDAWNKMEQELIQADPENAKIVRDNVRFMLDTENKELGIDDATLESKGNPYQKQTIEEAKLRDKNFDYIATRVFERKTYNAEKVDNHLNNMPIGKDLTTEEEVQTRNSFSKLYSQSLHYTINLKQEKLDKNKGIDKSFSQSKDDKDISEDYE